MFFAILGFCLAEQIKGVSPLEPRVAKKDKYVRFGKQT